MPSINNPGTAAMPSSRGPLLYPHQLALLTRIVAIYGQRHGQFSVSRELNRTTIYDPAMLEGLPCDYADVIALKRAGMIDAVGMNRHGITSFAPTALASALEHPDDYLDLSDEAWAIAKDTLRNRPARIIEVQRILRGIDDDPDAPDTIRDTARAADLLLGHVERYLDTENPGDEPLARASTASLRALAITILRSGAPLAIERALELARQVLGTFDG